MGQKSSIDKLPDSLRARLLEMPAGPSCTQTRIVETVNGEAGEAVLSKSAVNRYARKMKLFTEKNRQAREAAEAYLERRRRGFAPGAGAVLHPARRRHPPPARNTPPPPARNTPPPPARNTLPPPARVRFCTRRGCTFAPGAGAVLHSARVHVCARRGCGLAPAPA
ncbi:MAG: DUF3486 family protein [Spirochaetaceae bacterium]|jgi:hypothetical protein|nr:DUF3486 family protein [Spirochaetaceae bacterium]